MTCPKPHSVIGWTVVFALLLGPALALSQTPPEKLLLKDFHPKSIYAIPKTEVLKAKFPAVDVHSHAYAGSREEIDRWVKNMDDAGIERTVVLTGAVGSKFDSLHAEYSRTPDRFEVWCGFDLSGYDRPGFGPAAVAELERCARIGARGVGELSDKGRGLSFRRKPALGLHPDDPRMDPLFEKCADLGLPVNLHVADPIWMYQPMDSTNDGLMNALEWRLDDKPDIVDHAGMMAILERTVRRHPRTLFIACHFANLCYNLSEMGRMLDLYPNLYVDNGARYAETAAIPRSTLAFYGRYSDRILYGTDMGFDLDMYRITFRILETLDEHFYETDQFGYHWYLNGFGLDDGILKRVYKTNALNILKK
jgi:predicted TIM-barrel fold metal-dependent hydrolase